MLLSFGDVDILFGSQLHDSLLVNKELGFLCVLGSHFGSVVRSYSLAYFAVASRMAAARAFTRSRLNNSISRVPLISFASGSRCLRIVRGSAPSFLKSALVTNSSIC